MATEKLTIAVLGAGNIGGTIGRKWVSAGHQVYRAFNTYGYENFANPEFSGIQADLFFCGTEGDARRVVEQLIAAVGLRPVYLGGVEQVGMVDGIAGIWF